MKIATFNANSVRVRLGTILDWLAEFEPDILAIQETKCEDDKFPAADFEEAGWNVVFSGQKSYNGVAIVSREPAMNVRRGFLDDAWVDDKRIIAATFGDLRIVNTYVPNGSKVGSEKWEYKMGWMDRLHHLLTEELAANPNTIWLGDINIAPKPEDVYDSKRLLGGVGHHPDEFSRLERLTVERFTDVFRLFTQEPGHYTYWDFVIPKSLDRNLGWRIDHIYASKPMMERAVSCLIDRAPREGERPSDHTFVMAEFS